MKNEQKSFPIILGIIAINIGVALFKEFDFETFRFKKIGLGIVYLLTFIGTVAVIVKSTRGKE